MVVIDPSQGVVVVIIAPVCPGLMGRESGLSGWHPRQEGGLRFLFLYPGPNMYDTRSLARARSLTLPSVSPRVVS